MKLAESFLAHGEAAGTGGDRYQVLVHLEQDPLAADGTFAATLDDGTRVSAETFRRVTCDAAVVGIRSDSAGNPLDVGRRTRTIPPALRRALWSRDRGCRFPGCPNKIYVHAHHIDHWAHGGETSLTNLVLLCSTHHRLLHEGGFGVAAVPGRGVVFKDRAGREVDSAPAGPDARDAVSMVVAISTGGGVQIDVDTNLPQWDGWPVDYDAAVSAALGGGELFG